jgi:hypothetical protein
MNGNPVTCYNVIRMLSEMSQAEIGNTISHLYVEAKKCFSWKYATELWLPKPWKDVEKGV